MASRKEQKEKLRQERLEREAAAAQAAGRRRRMGYVVAGVLVAAVLVAVVAIAFASGGGDDTKGSAKASGSWPSASIPGRKTDDFDVALKASGCTFTSPKKEGAGHVTTAVKYKSQPPTSGSHNPVPAHDQAYLASPGNEHLVHALEHGRVIYWFRPSASSEARGALKKLYDEDNKLVVLTPDTAPMPYEVAATAWGKLLGCKTYSPKVIDAFRAFRDEYRLKGPEYFPNAE